jgi:hypothetical protein
MPDVLSADRGASAEPLPRPGEMDVPVMVRLWMVIFGFVPALHLGASLLPLVLAATGLARVAILWLAPVILFLIPPLVVRTSMWLRPLRTGCVDLDSADFLHWWFTAQWQILFARLPALEELIRMVPGLYSLWLRLWGARVGALVYWSPRVVIIDRPFVRIGRRVVFGIGATLNPHALAPDKSQRLALHLAPIVIGDDVLIGAYSHLLPGCEVDAGEVTPPFRTIHAFSRFAAGRRVRRSSTERAG